MLLNAAFVSWDFNALYLSGSAPQMGSTPQRPCQGKFQQATWPKTARKMKSPQETTSLGQIVTVTAKPTISDKHL